MVNVLSFPIISLGDLKPRDPELEAVAEKLQDGVRLEFADGMALFRTPDLAGLGLLAQAFKRRLHGDQSYFVLNRQVNPTNVCVTGCSFCYFHRLPGAEGAYRLSAAEVLSLLDDEVREVHIVGGHNPVCGPEYYAELITAIQRNYPRAQVKALTASEVDFLSRCSRRSPEDVLSQLKEAGLVALTGGGAEVFSERLHRQLFPRKASPERWLEIHRLAHQLGLKSNATMLYGHLETPAERVEHLLRLRELQDETGGFQAFIPLKFQVGPGDLVSQPATPVDDLRLVAAARLLLDNFPHIKAYWVMIGERTASVALNFGASDLDGTIGRERIAHDAGADSPPGLAREHMLGLIRHAGQIPVERDALYNTLAQW